MSTKARTRNRAEEEEEEQKENIIWNYESWFIMSSLFSTSTGKHILKRLITRSLICI